MDGALGALMYPGTGHACVNIKTSRRSVGHHRANRFALVHQIEALVDPIERHDVGDEIVDVDLAFHVPVDDPGDIGASARAAERGAFPYPSGDELKRPRLDLLSRPG